MIRFIELLALFRIADKAEEENRGGSPSFFRFFFLREDELGSPPLFLFFPLRSFSSPFLTDDGTPGFFLLVLWPLRS